MPGKKKKFIDKKNSTTFYLAHRSQKDPLIVDENAPQHVLVPLEDNSRTIPGTSKNINKSDHTSKKEEKIKLKEEEHKFGIYFDDDYNYLQHLKDSQEVSNIEWDVCERLYAPNLDPKPTASKPDSKDFKLILPSSVFDSEYKEEIGMLNKAAASHGPRPDLDPEVLAALDNDFDFEDPEGEIEDDFIAIANAMDPDGKGLKINKEDLEGLFSDEDYEDMEDDHESGDDEDGDTIGSMEGPKYDDFEDDDEENKTRFTNYSMSSSVVRRNKQLMLVDDRFEKIYEQYDDMDIGPLDCDDIEGDIGPESNLLLKYAEEFEKDKAKEEGLNEKISKIALDSNDSDDHVESSDEDEPKERWDCESILSTYSTTKNRPKLIKEPSKKRNIIQISEKTGIPLGVLGKGLTKGNLKQLDIKYAEENGLQISSQPKTHCSGISTIRSKNETTQERRERKLVVKEYRKERRLERKANTTAFKDEKQRQEKVRLNIKSNVQGLKL